jgi:hypothetical protein
MDIGNHNVLYPLDILKIGGYAAMELSMYDKHRNFKEQANGFSGTDIKVRMKKPKILK